MDVRIFTYEDTREIVPLFEDIYTISPDMIVYVHSICSKFAKHKAYKQLELLEQKIVLQYLLFSALEHAYFCDKDAYTYARQRVLYLYHISLYMSKSHYEDFGALTLAMLYAYHQHLKLDWVIGQGEMLLIQQHAEEVEICGQVLQTIPAILQSHNAYIARLEKQGTGVSIEIENILHQHLKSRITDIKKHSIAIEDLFDALCRVTHGHDVIKHFLLPIIKNSFGHPKARYVQANTVCSCLEESQTTSSEDPPAPLYCSLRRLGTNLGRSDEEIQQRLEDKAKQGATALARYLASSEGKLYFDLAGRSYAEIIRTINQELGTNIEEQAFQRAMTRNRLSFQ